MCGRARRLRCIFLNSESRDAAEYEVVEEKSLGDKISSIVTDADGDALAKDTGMLLLLVQCARHYGRWHDSIREEIWSRHFTDHQYLLDHWLSPYQLPRKTSQEYIGVERKR